eukprot:Rmarinus@m.29269
MGENGRRPNNSAKRERSETSERSSKVKKRDHSSDEYTFSVKMKETSNRGSLYSIAFNTICEAHSSYFATAGCSRISIYRYMGRGNVKLLDAYVDPDSSESYYACVWTPDPSVLQLAVGGKSGNIKIIDLEQKTVLQILEGHGGDVNDMCFHPADPNVLFSASKDESIRQWSVRDGLCVCVFGGHEGHRGDILSLSLNQRGDQLASCGMDHTVKIWAVDYKLKSPVAPAFRPVIRQIPMFSTHSLHGNYVDCVRWVGDYILSKSVENEVRMWKTHDSNWISIHNFRAPKCDIWFLRFAVNSRGEFFAVGNREGDMFVYDVDSLSNSPLQKIVNRSSAATIRQCSFNSDARILGWVCDDGTTWLYERVTPPTPSTGPPQTSSVSSKSLGAGNGDGSSSRGPPRSIPSTDARGESSSKGVHRGSQKQKDDNCGSAVRTSSRLKRRQNNSREEDSGRWSDDRSSCGNLDEDNCDPRGQKNRSRGQNSQEGPPLDDDSHDNDDGSQDNASRRQGGIRLRSQGEDTTDIDMLSQEEENAPPGPCTRAHVQCSARMPQQRPSAESVVERTLAYRTSPRKPSSNGSSRSGNGISSLGKKKIR